MLEFLQARAFLSATSLTAASRFTVSAVPKQQTDSDFCACLATGCGPHTGVSNGKLDFQPPPPHWPRCFAGCTGPRYKVDWLPPIEQLDRLGPPTILSLHRRDIGRDHHGSATPRSIHQTSLIASQGFGSWRS